MKKEKIKLLDGTVAEGETFEFADLIKLQKIYFEWIKLSKSVKELNGRRINVPDVLSEGIFCLAFDAIRTNGSAYSYDAVLRRTKEGIQIKSACIENDLTSFGPKSTWDKLYFADFSFSKVKGLIDFYEIPSEYIYSSVLNKNRKETFQDQQKQRRRPRLSIKSIIKEHKIKPAKSVNIETGAGLKK